MKKSNVPDSSRLTDTKNELSDQFKTGEGDSSIISDKKPLPARGEPRTQKEDVQNNIQDEFIDSQSNSKEE